jgi:hypothetical protein
MIGDVGVTAPAASIASTVTVKVLELAVGVGEEPEVTPASVTI